MQYGESFSIFGAKWAYIHFVENNGMAFGLSFGGDIGKLLLSVFRIIAVFFLAYLIRSLIKNKASMGILTCFSLVMAGALGNILDSIFYGVIFSESSFHGGLAELFPKEGGYASFLHGKVVDMFYFPLVDTVLPQWVPIWGGEHFEFFKPIFNVADASISVGIISLILFYRRFFGAENKIQPPKNTKEQQPIEGQTASTSDTPMDEKADQITA